MPPTIAKLVATIKTAKSKNSVFCEVPRADLSLNTLKVFRKYNLIYGTQATNGSLRSFFRYFRGKAAISSISLGTKPSRQVYLNKKRLTVLLKHNPVLIFVFSTPKGIVGLHCPTRSKKMESNTVGELFCFGW